MRNPLTKYLALFLLACGCVLAGCADKEAEERASKMEKSIMEQRGAQGHPSNMPGNTTGQQPSTGG